MSSLTWSQGWKPEPIIGPRSAWQYVLFGATMRSWYSQELWCKIEEIFRSSVYKKEMVPADITGGTKMMSVALTIVCVAPGRKRQYMDALRDWRGQPMPGQGSNPVVIDVDPILYGQM